MSRGHQGNMKFGTEVYRACKTDLTLGIEVRKVQSILEVIERL